MSRSQSVSDVRWKRWRRYAGSWISKQKLMKTFAIKVIDTDTFNDYADE